MSSTGRPGVVATMERLVVERRVAVVTRVRALESQLDAIRDARGGATADDEHDPEGSTLAMEWSRIAGQRADAEGELRELDAALGRMAAGTYGVCLSCGRPIPAERLHLLPATTLCVGCAAVAQGSV